MSTTYWVLGADDPEMMRIAALLSESDGNVVCEGHSNGKRVLPSSAYAVDSVKFNNRYVGMSLTGVAPDSRVIFVECAPTSEFRATFAELPVEYVDHHRPGDPGYGRPPAEFMQASSIGQVLTRMREPDEAARMTVTLQYVAWRWYRCGASWRAQEISPDIVLTAAADHCLGDAYRTKCPGVSYLGLRQFRVAQRAEFRRCSVGEVNADIDRAINALENAPFVEFGSGVAVRDMRKARHHTTYLNHPFTEGATVDSSGEGDAEWIDFVGGRAGCVDGCGHTHTVSDIIPELPEAACIAGKAFLTEVSDRDGRKKVVIQAASTEQVTAFFAWASAQGLTSPYGDPARGFAGAYLSTL